MTDAVVGSQLFAGMAKNLPEQIRHFADVVDRLLPSPQRSHEDGKPLFYLMLQLGLAQPKFAVLNH